jgi:predicted nucleotidyltransferase
MLQSCDQQERVCFGLVSNQDLMEISKRTVQASKEYFGDKLDKVILYGSYARGDFDDESDIDIMVLADIALEDRWQSYIGLCDLLGMIDLEFDVLVSINVTDCKTFYEYIDALPFYRNVMKDGVLLSA